MSISISIEAGKDSSSSSVKASGNVWHVIADTERSTYDIWDASLKNAIQVYRGRIPDDAFVRSPTPWGDLYRTYEWKEVTTDLAVADAYITGITSEPVIIATKTLINNSSHTADFDASISETVTYGTNNSWSSTHSIEVSQEFSYDVKFLGSGGGGSTSLSYSHEWGQEKSESKEVSVGSSSGVTVTLDPGQSVIAKLTASRGVLGVRIAYKASLSGGTAYNYSDPFEGHHFWWTNINVVMNAAHMPASRTFSEDIQVGYYSDAVVELTDNKSGLVIARVDTRKRHPQRFDLRISKAGTNSK